MPLSPKIPRHTPLQFTKRGGVSVQPVNEYEMYELATFVHPLTILDDDTKYSQCWWSLWGARQVLNDTFNVRRPLSFSKPAADALHIAINAFLPSKFEDAIAKFPTAEKPEDPSVGWLGHSIREAAKNFETVLAAETKAMDTYLVSQKGSYKTSDLIARAHIALPATIIPEVPEQCIVDFNEAGKCIAFDVATGAAFHLMRATETVIRKYYKVVVGKEPKQKMRNWGAYIGNLKECNAEQKVTDLLEHIRVAYRNPILHPEENFTPEKSLVLFGISVSAISLMVEEIRRLENQSKPLAFPVRDAIALP
jgi:hypothetical protein